MKNTFGRAITLGDLLNMVIKHLLKGRILQVGRKRWEQVKVYGGGNVVEVTLG